MGDKRKEADENMAKGDARVKTSLTRWKPDYDGAAVFYDRAATCYKGCRENELAIKAYKKLSECHQHLDTLSSAAVALENASQLTKDQNEVANLLASSGEILLQGMFYDRAANAFLNAARAAEKANNKELAVENAKRVCTVLEDGEREHFANDPFLAALALCLRCNDLPAAIEVATRLSLVLEKIDQPANLWKMYLSVIILHLANNDFDAADDAFHKYCQTAEFTNSEQWFAAGDLLQAFEKANTEMLAAAVKTPSIQYLENSIARVARDLKIQGGPYQSKHAINLADEDDPLHGQNITDDSDVL